MLITKKTQELHATFKKGGVFAYPTEAVYGLGCDPDNEAAVQRLLLIKNRPVEKGLILIASDFSQVRKYLKPLSKAQEKLTIPSNITYVFPACSTAPKWLTGHFDSLAIRITKHSLTRELCQVLNSALVSTSANVAGQKPAKNEEDIPLKLKGGIDAILSGLTGNLEKPTEIRDGITGSIVRHS